MEFTIEIAAPIEQVFSVIADLAAYPRWLPSSGLYDATVEVSETPIRLGTTYVDRSKQATLYGQVTAFSPPERVAFRQETRMLLGRLRIDIQYRLEARGTGTRVYRTTSPQLFGALAFLRRPIVRSIRNENIRTLDMMKQHLEHEASS